MSFVDNQKIVGWAFFIVGLLMVVNALLYIVDAAGMEGGITGNMATIVIAIGALISAVLYFLYGNKVRTETITGKLNILGNYVRIVGVCAVIDGLFVIIAGVFMGSAEGLIGGIVAGIIAIILGLIPIWAAGKILDGKETTIDKILWILLVIIFALLFITGLLSIGGTIVSIISAICSVIVYLFMLLYLFDGDVKKQMGM